MYEAAATARHMLMNNENHNCDQRVMRARAGATPLSRVDGAKARRAFRKPSKPSPDHATDLAKAPQNRTKTHHKAAKNLQIVTKRYRTVQNGTGSNEHNPLQIQHLRNLARGNSGKKRQQPGELALGSAKSPPGAI